MRNLFIKPEEYKEIEEEFKRLYVVEKLSFLE
jgi:hypothetical protein